MTTEPLTPDAALVRLSLYGERTKTWSTATHDTGTERALHQIATTLGTEVTRLRVELDNRSTQYAEAAATLAEEVLRSGKRIREHDADREELERLRSQLAAADTSVVCDAEGHAIPHSPSCPSAARTKRDRWQTLTDALNAVGSVGIDQDGTLTDHTTYSVIWHRDAMRWVLAHYDD